MTTELERFVIRDWNGERKARKTAPLGTRFYLGPTNFGRDKLILPLVRRTATQLVCSDGERTERIMIDSGKVVGRRNAARLIADNA